MMTGELTELDPNYVLKKLQEYEARISALENPASEKKDCKLDWNPTSDDACEACS